MRVGLTTKSIRPMKILIGLNDGWESLRRVRCPPNECRALKITQRSVLSLIPRPSSHLEVWISATAVPWCNRTRRDVEATEGLEISKRASLRNALVLCSISHPGQQHPIPGIGSCFYIEEGTIQNWRIGYAPAMVPFFKRT